MSSIRTRSSAGCISRGRSRGRLFARLLPTASCSPPTPPLWSWSTSSAVRSLTPMSQSGSARSSCVYSTALPTESRSHASYKSAATQRTTGFLSLPQRDRAIDHHRRRRPSRPSSLSRHRYSYSGGLSYSVTGSATAGKIRAECSPARCPRGRSRTGAHALFWRCQWRSRVRRRGLAAGPGRPRRA